MWTSKSFPLSNTDMLAGDWTSAVIISISYLFEFTALSEMSVLETGTHRIRCTENFGLINFGVKKEL